MVRLGYACVLVGATCVAVASCARSSRWPKMVEGAQYEVSNPTQCTAQIYTATENNVTRRLLGQVQSGGRAVVTVPPRSGGTRVVAMALYRDGTDCDVEGRIRVRRLGS
jgi:hypothetical protein